MGEYTGEVRKLASKMMVVMDENLGLLKGYIKKTFTEGMDDGEDTTFFGTKVFTLRSNTLKFLNRWLE
ncbi:unnamed protein product [Brassica oleracea]